MRQFTQQYQGVNIQRQTYTGNVSAYSSSSTTTGYLRSLDAEAASQNGFQYGYAFSLICELGVDIQVGDKVVIGGKTYDVKGVTSNGLPNNPAAFLKALVTLPE